MSTEINLQYAIKKILQDDVFKKLSLFEPDEMNVYVQDIPLLTEYEKEAGYEYEYDENAEDNEIDKYLPCCIVKLRGAEIKNASAPQITTVEIIVIIKDWSKDMSGNETLMICLNRIRNHFFANAGIQGKFRLEYPVKLVVNEDAAIPYFIGSITTKWSTPIQTYEDPLGFL